MSTPPTTGRGGRSRIVIDVEKARKERRGRAGGGGGRARKVLLAGGTIAAVVVAVVIAAGYLWWSSYRRSPVYSLALLVDAAQRDDLQTVDQMLDGDALAQNLTPQIVEKLTGAAPAPGTVAAARPQLEAMMPQLVPRVREGVRDEVARGVKAASEKIGGRLPFPLLALGLKRYTEVAQESDAAATVRLAAEGHAMELGMRQEGDRWKVTSIKDDALVSSIAARVAPALPAPRPAATPTPRPRPRGARN